jgi:hypothetical protein
MKIHARQIECNLEKIIKAQPETVFPMLCPVLEEKWIPGWQYDLLHAPNGVNEEGCIFREELSGVHYFEEPVCATWTTIVHDPAAHRVEFLIHYGDRALARTRVRISAVDGGCSKVQWHKVLTSTDKRNDRFSDAVLKQRILASLTFIAESLSNYFDSDPQSADHPAAPEG